MSRLRELHLDCAIVIPGAKNIAGGVNRITEQAFHIEDGWDVRETLPGVFSISRDDMAEAVTVGGYGYTYVRAEPETVPEAPEAKRKKR